MYTYVFQSKNIFRNELLTEVCIKRLNVFLIIPLIQIKKLSKVFYN